MAQTTPDTLFGPVSVTHLPWAITAIGKKVGTIAMWENTAETET